MLGNCENIVYELKRAPKRSLIVRVTESKHRSRKELNAELDWMHYLSENGLNIGAPLPNSDSEFISTQERRYHIGIFKKALGKHPDPKIHWNAQFA